MSTKWISTILAVFLVFFVLVPSARAVDTKVIDTDKDGLPDRQELSIGTDPKNYDSDNDGFLDGMEVKNGYDPLNAGKNRLPKLIKVNLKEQKLAYFVGQYKVDEFKISSGIKSMPTPKGEFTVLTKRPVVNYSGPGYSFPNTKWNLMFKRGKGFNYYIHGAYWHNKFGRPMSHGCVNVSYQNMPFLYEWADNGTNIIIDDKVSLATAN